MKLNRRNLLWSGLGATLAAAFGRDHLERRAEQAEQAKLKQIYDPTQVAQDAFGYDIRTREELAAIQQSAKLRSPVIPYSRDWSKLLIVGSKLCTQQYLRGKVDADYDGSITALPLYTQGFTTFKQVASFKAAERVDETVPIEVPIELPLGARASGRGSGKDLGDRVNQTKEAIKSQVKRVVQLRQKTPVYFGFLLTTAKANLLMFRGTQRQSEWLEDVLAVLTPYHNPVDQMAIGNAHLGIYDFYKTFLAKPVAEAVKLLEPNKPLIVAGHSLGAGLATLAAMDLALLYPKLRTNLQLYAYAGPRVGDKAFIEAHSQLIPNHYRIINLADMIPLLPMSKQFKAEFVHGGELWTFLSYQGDILPNHTAETYRIAIERETETKSEQRR